MKKYLLLTRDFPPRRGGIARYLDALATSLSGAIRVIAPPEAGDRVFDATAPYPIERKELLFRFLWPRWKKAVLLLWARRASYRVALVSHVLPLGTAAWIAGWFTRRPYVVFVHGMDIGLAMSRPLKQWLAGRVLRGAARVVTNSHALEREVREVFKVERSLVVYPCLSQRQQYSAPKVFDSEDQTRGADPSPAQAGRLRRLSENAPLHHSVTLLTVARLVPRKGHLRVLDALVHLREIGCLGDLRQDGILPYGKIRFVYRIVGDGPMLEMIRDRVQKLRLGEIVGIETNIADEQLPSIYSDADILVMPTVAGDTDREGFGLVYLEAAAYGVPAIATRQSGVDEAVLDGETGLLVPDGDIKALAEAIHRLTTDETLRRRLGEQARGRALREFSCERAFDTLKSILAVL